MKFAGRSNPVKRLRTAFVKDWGLELGAAFEEREREGKVPVKPPDQSEIPFTNPFFEQCIPAHHHKVTLAFVQFWFKGQLSPLQGVEMASRSIRAAGSSPN